MTARMDRAKQHKRRLRKASEGVALITILLVVVIATVLGVAMTTDQHFAVNRARTLFDHTVIRQYAFGGEELARQILHKDFVDAPETDHLGEDWAATDLLFEFEDGAIEILIEDLQGKINVNSLLQQGQQAALAKTRVQTIFTEQSLDRVFVDRMIDWIDENANVSGLGAEDFDYLGLDRPYRTANQMMVDVSEMRLILDMDDETYALVAPNLSTIPDINTTINVNTATPAVIQAIAPGLSFSDAELITSERDSGVPFNNIQEFTGNPSLGTAATSVNTDGLSVQSSFFRVSVRARVREKFGYLTSVIQRNRTDGTLKVIYRDLSKKIQPFIVEDDV